MAGFESATFRAMLAPAGTPPAVLDRVADIVLGYSRRDDTRAAVTQAGFMPIAGGAAAFAAHKAADSARWEELIRSRGIRLS